MANKAGELAGNYLCGPLRISAFSALKGYFNAEGRRDTQRAAENLE
jgi:hypothetical protein